MKLYVYTIYSNRCRNGRWLSDRHNRELTFALHSERMLLRNRANSARQLIRKSVLLHLKVQLNVFQEFVASLYIELSQFEILVTEELLIKPDPESSRFNLPPPFPISDSSICRAPVATESGRRVMTNAI